MPGPAQATLDAPAVPSVGIELGPDTALYPESIRPADPTPPPAQESEQATAEPPTEQDAGSEEQPPQEAEPKSSRRQKGEDAYQRGLREGREAADKERTEREQTEARTKAVADEQARIRQLFRDLKSPDYDTRTRAGESLAGMVDTTELNQGIEVRVRTAVLNEIADGLKQFGTVDGVGEDGHKALIEAKTPGEFAKTAFDLGVKHARSQADERIAELEAQLEAARGRRAATSLTPERSNGSNGSGSRLTLEEYQRMSPQELRKAGITSADIDAMVADMMAEAERTRR